MRYRHFCLCTIHVLHAEKASCVHARPPGFPPVRIRGSMRAEARSVSNGIVEEQVSGILRNWSRLRSIRHGRRWSGRFPRSAGPERRRFAAFGVSHLSVEGNVTMINRRDLLLSAAAPAAPPSNKSLRLIIVSLPSTDNGRRQLRERLWLLVRLSEDIGRPIISRDGSSKA